MYFFKQEGKQCLDLRGNLILSHNNALVKCRSKSAAPSSVKNPKYILNIKEMSFIRKVRATFAAIGFIWGENQALTTDNKEVSDVI